MVYKTSAFKTRALENFISFAKSFAWHGGRIGPDEVVVPPRRGTIPPNEALCAESLFNRDILSEIRIANPAKDAAKETSENTPDYIQPSIV